MRVCVCVCLSLASDSSETIRVIIKFGTVTASDMRMHDMLIILTLAFIQVHRYIKYSIISESFQEMPIMFAVKIVRIKVYIICS